MRRTVGLRRRAPALAIVLAAASGQGIRAMTPGPDGKGFLVVVGNATSEDPSVYSLYAWDGNERGEVRRLAVTFQKGMKPEGVSVGTVGGRPSVVFTDDAGGFQVVPLADLRAAGM